MSRILSILFRPWLARTARQTLVGRNRDPRDPRLGRFTAGEVRRLMRGTWRHFGELDAALPEEPTPGSRLNVRLAALTLAFHRSLREAGIPEDYAADLVADAGWRIYSRWGRIALTLGSITARTRRGRMQRMLELFLRFPFNAPGYRYEWKVLPDGFGTEFHRCPVADFFRSQGEARVCQQTWCTFDFPLAELAGGRYRRTKTLSAGDSVCDMVWEVR